MAARRLSSSSAEASPTCPVCLRELANCKLGKPENCSHLFCFTCLFEWSKNVNTCPVDRIKFNNIEVLTHKGGKCINKVYVIDHTLTEALQDPNEVTYCEVCHECTREDRLLLCDGCDKGRGLGTRLCCLRTLLLIPEIMFHMECLRPPLSELPAGDWYCPVCEPIVMAQHFTAEESYNSTLVVNSISCDSDSEGESSFEPLRKTRRLRTQFHALQTSSSSESESERGEEDDLDSGPRATRSGYKRCNRLQISSEESSESESDKGDDPLISHLSAMRKRKRQLRMNPQRTILESDGDSSSGVLAHPAVAIQDPCCSRHLTANLPKTSNHHSENGEISGYTSDESMREVAEETDVEAMEDKPPRYRNCTRNRASRKAYNTRSSVVEETQPTVLLSEPGEPRNSMSRSEHSTSSGRPSKPEKTARRRKTTASHGKNQEQFIVSSDHTDDDGASIHSGYCSSGSGRNSSHSFDRSLSMILHRTDSESEYVPDETPFAGSPSPKKIALRPRDMQGNVANSRMPLLEGLSNHFEEYVTDETSNQTYSQCVRRKHTSNSRKIALRPRDMRGNVANSRMPLLDGLPGDFEERITDDKIYSPCVRRKPASKRRRKKNSKGKKSRTSSAAKGKGKGSLSKTKGKQRRRRRKRRKIRIKKPDPFAITSPIRTRARTAATHTPRGSLFRRAVIESHQHENMNEGLERARAVLNTKHRKESLQNTPFRSGITDMFGSTSASRVITTPRSGFQGSCSSPTKKSDPRHSKAAADSTPLSYGRLVGRLRKQGRASQSGTADEVTRRIPLKRKLSMESSGLLPPATAEKLEEKLSQSGSVDLLGGICQGLDDLHNRNNIIRRDGTIQPIRGDNSDASPQKSSSAQDGSDTSPQKSSSAPLPVSATVHGRWSSEGNTSEHSDDMEVTQMPRSHTHRSKNRHHHPASELTQRVLRDHNSSANTSDEASTATAPKLKLQANPLSNQNTHCSHAYTSRSLTDSGYSTCPKLVGNDCRLPVPVKCSRDVITGRNKAQSGDGASSSEESSEGTVTQLDRGRCTFPTAEEAERTVRIALKDYYRRGEITEREYRRILQRATKKVESGPIIPDRIHKLIRDYVEGYQESRRTTRSLRIRPSLPLMQ